MSTGGDDFGTPTVCQHCAASIPPGSSFCSRCGSRVRVPVAPRGSTLPGCSACGAGIDPRAAFCWRCGVPISSGEVPWIPANALESQGEPRPTPVSSSLDPNPVHSGRGRQIVGPPAVGSLPPGAPGAFPVPPSHVGLGVAATVLIVCLAVVGGIGAGWVMTSLGALPVENRASQPPPGFATISSVGIIVIYANGTGHYLGTGTINGCEYENCPIEVKFTPTAGTLNIAILNQLSPSNGSGHSATPTRLTSVPAGITMYSATPFTLFAGVLVWSGIIIEVSAVSATYNVTVTVSAN